MRLFIAINFEEKTKNQIAKIIDRIQPWVKKGRFVEKGHMHLTLEFLGEISPDRVEAIQAAMDQIEAPPFTLQLSRIGFFKRDEGDIYWLGVKPNDALFALQKRLHDLLADEGFDLEKRKYTPHITLGRKVRVTESFDLVDFSKKSGAIKVKVDRIHLMESTQEKGQLVYSAVYSKQMGKPAGRL